jgi:hypothetical protein
MCGVEEDKTRWGLSRAGFEETFREKVQFIIVGSQANLKWKPLKRNLDPLSLEVFCSADFHPLIILRGSEERFCLLK